MRKVTQKQALEFMGDATEFKVLRWGKLAVASKTTAEKLKERIENASKLRIGDFLGDSDALMVETLGFGTIVASPMEKIEAKPKRKAKPRN